MSKRDDIVTEMIRRLTSAFPDSYLFEGDGGVWGSWGRQLPAVHYYELTESLEQRKKGVYNVTLPIQIEYFKKMTSRNEMFTEGRATLEELQNAVELDERFAKGLVRGQDLAYTYSMVSNEIIEVLDSLVGVGVIYEIEYTTPFLGYGKLRC